MVRHKAFMRLHRSEPLRQYMSPVIKLSAIQLCVPMSTIDRYLSRCAFRRFLRWNPLTWNMDTKYLSAYGMPNNRLSEDQRVHHRAIPNRNSMVGSMGCSTWMFQISGTNPHTSLPLHVCLESSCCLYFCACIDMPGGLPHRACLCHARHNNGASRCRLPQTFLSSHYYYHAPSRLD